MTLSTDVYILDEVDPKEVFRFCQGLLTKYDDPRHLPPEQQQIRHQQDTSYTGTPGVWEVQPDNPWSLDNVVGQNLPAWLMTAYRPGAPLRTADDQAQHDADCNMPGTEYYDEESGPCDGKYHDRACFMSVDFDTAYSYKDVRGWGCGDLHAAIVAELGMWLTAKGIRWEWRNEFTGDVHDNPEALVELVTGGVEAGAWFRNSVLPAIVGEIATSGGGQLEIGGTTVNVPDLRGGAS